MRSKEFFFCNIPYAQTHMIDPFPFLQVQVEEYIYILQAIEMQRCKKRGRSNLCLMGQTGRPQYWEPLGGWRETLDTLDKKILSPTSTEYCWFQL